MNHFLQIVIVCPDSALRKYQEFSRNASLLTRNSKVFRILDHKHGGGSTRSGQTCWSLSDTARSASTNGYGKKP